MLDHDVARVLAQQLGAGEFPLVRKRLFARLQRVCEQKGDIALRIVAEVLQEAQGPRIRNRGKYFCFAVVRRLTEAGFWASPGGANETADQARANVEAIKQRVADPTPAAKAESEEEIYNRVAQQRADEVRRRLADRRPERPGAL